MINLFKSLKQVAVLERPKTTNELIEEIHSAFYSEGEALLAQAQAVLAAPVEKEVNLGSRLRKLGFAQAPSALKAEKVASERRMSESLKERIEYYNANYPLHRFITEDGVQRICEKYDLICGEVSKYIGSVPEENLIHIENFKGVQEKDMCYYVHTTWDNNRRPCSYSEYKTDRTRDFYPTTGYCSYYSKEDNLSICAPMKDFNTEGMDIRDRKLVARPVPDPIVLFPVNGGYLIITAWGKESNDEQVKHAKNN